jgi:hypothetical protein
LPEVFVDTRDNAPLIAAGGGLVLFISLFLSWFGDFSGWETLDFTDIVLAVIALLALAVGASIATGNALNVPGGPGETLSAAGLIAFAMVATLIFEGDERKFGIFLALIATIAILVGAFQLARGPAAPRAPRARAASDAPTQTQPPPPPPPSQGTGGV